MKTAIIFRVLRCLEGVGGGRELQSVAEFQPFLNGLVLPSGLIFYEYPRCPSLWD